MSSQDACFGVQVTLIRGCAAIQARVALEVCDDPLSKYPRPVTRGCCALTAGVPLVCIPQGRDQSDNAERVAASGVGRAVATGAPPAQIACALEELLADPAALREARRFAGVIAGLGGGDAATREVAGLARSRAPASQGRSW